MAVTEMKRINLNFKSEYLEKALHLMQGFQGIQLETTLESSVPNAKKAEIERTLIETEKILQEIKSAFATVKGWKTEHTKNRERTFNISEFEEAVEKSGWKNLLGRIIHIDRQRNNNEVRRKRADSLLEELRPWEELKYNPLDFEKLKLTAVYYGSVHEKHAAEFEESLRKYSEDGMYIERIGNIGERAYFLAVCHNSFKHTLDSYMTNYSFSVLKYGHKEPQSAVREALEKEQKQLIEEERQILKEIETQKDCIELLGFAEDYFLNKMLRMKKSLEVTYNKDTVEIEGWIIAEKSEQFIALIAKNIPDSDYEISIDPIKNKDIENVPIKLKNSRIVSTYESLTEMYSLPKYNEIDPTPVMTFFYMILFGMMVADAGYGLAFFIIGLIVRKSEMKRSTKKMVGFLWGLSIPVMGWGLIYGSFCGIRLPFGLIDNTVDIMTMTLISIVIGYCHIMTGLFLQMLNQFKLKSYKTMLTGGLAWFLTFLGGGVAVLAKFVDTPAFLFTAGLAVTFSGLAVTLFVPAITAGKRWYFGIFKGLYALYGATSYLGDFVSYTRLMALGVAGGSVAIAFNTILGFLPVPVRFTLGIALAVALHGLNIFLSMLSAYVHGMRLQFIEFFGKFYTGGGKKWEPFKPVEKNVIIIESEVVQ